MKRYMQAFGECMRTEKICDLLLATASMCFMPLSWVALAEGLSCNHTLQ